MGVRITDAMMSNNYLSTMNKIKNRISKLNEDIVTQEKIHAPSDSPTGITKLLSLNKRISESDTYISNIEEANSFVSETINTMESIQSEVTSAVSMLTEINDDTKNSALQSYSEKINSILESILSNANAETNGKYIFGGTDFSSRPYELSSDGSFVSLLVDDISGSNKIKITSNTEVTTNVNGASLFNTIVEQSGNIDSTTAVGGTVTSQTNVYDGAGNEYTLNLTYTKTAANTYNMDYTIDQGATTVYSSPETYSLKFDSTDGKLLTVNGDKSTSINISVPTNNISFTFEMGSTTETSAAGSLSYSANQERDIFSTLIAIRDKLASGIKPSEEDAAIVGNFNTRVLDKIASMGNTTNQLDNTKALLENRKMLLTNLVANENEVDVTQAILDLENQEYMLQLSYKTASTILPQSLLDYL